jgi:beta-glucosidase
MTLPEKVSQMQNAVAAIPRLGIPDYKWWNEALHGVARAGLATSFPQAIGLAAAWDTGLMFQVADAISTEARAKYNQAQIAGDRTATTASPSGPRTSTYSATRAGAAARRLTAKIPT